MSFNIQELGHGHLQNRHEDAHDIVENHGVTRSYDCVFCRRGFTTAQALGGHMNIHRKDRATTNINRPSNNNITVDKPRTKDMLLEIDNNDQNNNTTTTRVFFSSKSCFNSDKHHGNSSFERRYLAGSHHMHGGKNDEEVDLELRLGHYPW